MLEDIIIIIPIAISKSNAMAEASGQLYLFLTASSINMLTLRLNCLNCSKLKPKLFNSEYVEEKSYEDY